MINASGADLLFVAYGAPKQVVDRAQPAAPQGQGGDGRADVDFIAAKLPLRRRLGVEWLTA
jgi:hypothetical protein